MWRQSLRDWWHRRLACATMCLLLLLGTACTSKPARTLYPIGGGLEPSNRAAYGAMLAGLSPGARIVIAPFASGESDAAFARARDAFLLHDPQAKIERMADATLGEAQARLAVAQLQSAQLVFMTGGDQSRLTPRFRGSDGEHTMVGRAMLRSDLVVAGTSAGAAIMSHPMFTGGGSEAALAGLPSGDESEPNVQGVRLGAGLGATQAGTSQPLLIDTHVLARGRYGRMLAALQEGEHIAALGLADGSGARVELFGDGSTIISVLHDDGALLCWLRAEGAGDATQGEPTPGAQTPGVPTQSLARVSLLRAGDVVTLAPAQQPAARFDRAGLVVRPRRSGETASAKLVKSGAFRTSIAAAAQRAERLQAQRMEEAKGDGEEPKTGAWESGVLEHRLLRLAADPSQAFACESERFVVRVWADEQTRFAEHASGAISIWGARIDVSPR